MPNSPFQPSLKVKNSALLAVLVLAASALACSAQTVEELGVTRHSAFDDSGQRRDPFLPIGWERPASAPVRLVGGAPVAATTESYLKPEAFEVSSISLDRLPLAVINGKAYGEGESVPFLAGDKKIKLQVYSIRDGTVTLRYNEFKVTCLIRVWQKPALPGGIPNANKTR